MARRVLKQMEDKLVFTEEHGAAPAPGVAEQNGFEHIMAGHTARYGACLTQLYLATGDEEVKRRALSTLHGVTHMQTDAGIFVTFFYNAKKPADSTKKKPAGNTETDRVWFSQHLFSIYNLLGAMTVFPQLAPDTEAHILHHTTALRDVTYATAVIGYTATAPVQVKAKLTHAPKTITLDGKPLRSSDQLPSKDSEPAWHFDPATRLLTLHHSAGKVEIMK
jgi:hypothetical protein